MEGFKTFADVTAKYAGITASILARAIKYGLFPGARRKGEHQHYLPDDEVDAFIAFRKLSRGEQVRQFHNDIHLMTTEEVSILIGIDVGHFAKYRKKGLLPEHRFLSFYQVRVYHIDDVMEFVEKNRMLYDKNMAEKFGWKSLQKTEENAKSEDGKFNPMLQKRGVRF